MKAKFIPDMKELAKITNTDGALLDEFWVKYQEFHKQHGNLFQHFNGWQDAVDHFIKAYCVNYGLEVEHKHLGNGCTQIRNRIVVIHRDTRDRLEHERIAMPVSETTEDWYVYSRDVVYPENWVQKEDGTSTFASGEPTCGEYSEIYARVNCGGVFRYFHLVDKANLPHDEIVRRVKEFMS